MGRKIEVGEDWVGQICKQLRTNELPKISRWKSLHIYKDSLQIGKTEEITLGNYSVKAIQEDMEPEMDTTYLEKLFPAVKCWKIYCLWSQKCEGFW